MVALTVPQIQRESVQDFPNARKGEGEAAFWSFVTTRGYSLSAWATRARERELRNLFLHENNWMGQGAFAGLSKKVAATAWEISGKRNVDHFQTVLREANFQAGWNVFIERVVLDYLRQDGGAYIEVIAPGRPLRPPTGKATGIAHLDSLRCFPTGDPQYPVIYYSRKGTKHLLHASRVIHLVDLSDGDESNPGYGHCALSRAVSIVNQQIYMNRFIEQKLDDKPPPGYVTASNIEQGKRNAAFEMYRQEQGNDARPEWGKTVWFYSLDPSAPAKLEFTTFSQAPEGYSYKEYTELHVNAWALAIGCDVQELWQLTGGSLGSGQQSTILHAKSQGKTFGDLLTKLERSLNDVLPDYLEFQFKRRDSQEEAERATTASAWAGFTSSVAATLSMDEQRRLLASLIEPYKDIVTDENGEVIERDDLDPQAPENEPTVDDATPAASEPTETQEAPAVRADAKKEITATKDTFIDYGDRIASTRADFERDFNALLAEARGDETNRRSFSVRLRNQLRIYGERAYQAGLDDGGADDITLSAQDRIIYVRMLAAQSSYVSNFSATLFTDGIGDGLADTKAALWFKGSILPFYYAGIESADENTNMEWRLGLPEHCSDCPRLDGQVHSIKEWRIAGFFPGNGHTECDLGCKCGLMPTKKPKNGRFLN